MLPSSRWDEEPSSGRERLTQPSAPQAWAAFKGKLSDGDQDNPACWKTRLRCALNKSPEFTEVLERAQLDISDPYKVYRLVPFSEQGEAPPAGQSVVSLPSRLPENSLKALLLLQEWLFLTRRAEPKPPRGQKGGGAASWRKTTAVR